MVKKIINIESIDLESNAIKYNQYRSVWCKVLDYDEIGKKTSTDTEIMKELLEQIYLYWTPERWGGLEYECFKPSENQHIKLAHEIVQACLFYDNKEVKEALEERDDFIESYSDWPDARDSWYKTNGTINEKNELINQYFIDYEALKDIFIHQLFTDNARFYINQMPQEAIISLYDGKISNEPAIIGIDDERAGLFWFNFY